MNKSDLNDIHVNESKVRNNVFNSRKSNGDDNQVNDRFKKVKGYHVILPPYTGNYMPPRADLSFAGLDISVFKSKVSETITSVPKIETNASKTSKDSLEKPKTVRSSAPLIEDWELDILTKSGQVPVKAAKQSSHREATSVSAARHFNTDVSRPNVNNALPITYSYFKAHSPGNPHYALQDQGIFDSGYSRHMTRNKSYLTDYQEIDGGIVAFAGNAKGGKITGNGKIRIGKLDFEDVYFVKELKFNPFSVSQMCDKKNSVLFTNTECVVLSHDFKLLDKSQVLLKVPRNNNMYIFDLKNVIPVGGIENQMDHKVKTIRCDNGTEFKNRIMNKFCEMKGIKREFSVTRTP
nr:ribonuclease H-like domain-containing protein [Tanacetum cinerariifolium]